ncbi:MAG: DEAD/DEAH box helicase [Candidatus Helarchaeota archaeon]|nr:DEAD/DEAH box helicase [Deltaproteobacteria bacterium]
MEEWQVSINWLDSFSIEATTPARIHINEAPFKHFKLEDLFGAEFIPYHIQVQTWQAIATGKSLLLVSGTGSGKTEGIVPAIVDQLLEEPKNHCLLMFPLKALAQDQEFRLRENYAHLGLTIQRYDSSIAPQVKRKIRAHPGNLLLITPDTLMGSLLKTTNPEWAKYLRKPAMIWIDEFHAMSGTLGTALCYLLRILCRQNPSLQVYLTSATVANAYEIAEHLPNQPIIIKGSSCHGNIRFYIGTTEDLEPLLEVLFQDNGQFLIFMENKRKIEALAAKKALLSRLVERYHADLPDYTRHLILTKFRAKRLKGLLCTSAISLGIDIPYIKNVVLYEFPRSFSLLFQEIGRGTRDAAAEGNVFLLLNESRLSDSYYLSHLAELKADLLSYRAEPVVLDLLNEKILRGMVLFAIKLGCTTHEHLSEVFPEAEDRQRLEAVEVWLLIHGFVMKAKDVYTYYKEEADRFLLEFLQTLRPSFPKYKLLTANDGQMRHVGDLSSENIPYCACKGNYYLIGEQCYLIQAIDSYRREIYLNPVPERYISKNRVTTVVRLRRELKFKRFFGLKIRLAEVQVRIAPKTLRTYELRENNREVLVHEEHPPKGRALFSFKYETKGVLLEFLASPLPPLSHMVLYQLSKIVLRNAMRMLNVSEGEVDCLQTPELRTFYFLDRSCPTGVSQQLYENIERLLERTYQILSACPCPRGCENCAIPVESSFLQPNFSSTDIYRKQELLTLLRRCLYESRALE